MEEKFGPRYEWECSFFFRQNPDSYDEVTQKAINKAGRCYGDINGHEILKRSRGGSITIMENVVLLCNWHNSWVENHPYAANQLGLANHSWDEK
jgi:hypothetical protein